ncbi:sugar ABC transporter permease [Natronococcus pandeyae]|uniref:Sugar ABC transporter permease n=1 Tax=Natronococcus pandeyae TaxID=2055836 RepID=A0A8J8TQX7_9EURY|nr:sugar ABC transporter permease [Natronococcus pandeyae]TYL37360.1 sugar ABC transporter permease [Natronococcus pandeyae]
MSQREAYGSTLQAILLLLPTIAIFAVFLYWPAARTIWLGFYETQFFGQGGTWVGIDQYLEVLQWDRYHNSVVVTLKFALVTIVGTLVISILISYWIYTVDRFKTVYMVATIWPYAMPGAVAGTVLLVLLHPEIGLISAPIEAVMPFEWDWRVNGTQAFWVVSLGVLWYTLGFDIIFLLAAFHSIPDSLNEAASLDGVPQWRMLYKVYLPIIAPTLLFLLVLNTLGGFFGGFAIVDLVTNGGPTQATNLMVYQLYQSGFQQFNIGSAAVQSVYLFVIAVVLAIAQIVISDKRIHYGG